MKGPKTSLEQWRALQAVVDAGGFAQAAQRLHRSQSSISYAVARLQDALGVPLLETRGRRAILNECGVVLLRRARQLLREAVELEQLAKDLQRGWEAEIRLSIEAALPNQVLMATLERFAPQSRGTRIQLQQVVLSGSDDALLEGQADLVIGAQVPSGYLGEALMAIELVAVAHPDHTLHRLGHELGTEDLRHATQVVISDSGHHHRQDAGWLGAEQRWTVANFETAITIIRRGLGFGWIVRHHITEALASGALKPLPLKTGQIRKAHLYLIFADQERPGPATRLLAQLFRETASAPGGPPAA